MTGACCRDLVRPVPGRSPVRAGREASEGERTEAGSVYADSFGQRGDKLFDSYDAALIREQWDALLRLHREGAYVSGSAIAEGGLMLHLFEASYGSGLGARIERVNET